MKMPVVITTSIRVSVSVVLASCQVMSTTMTFFENVVVESTQELSEKQRQEAPCSELGKLLLGHVEMPLRRVEAENQMGVMGA